MGVAVQAPAQLPSASSSNNHEGTRLLFSKLSAAKDYSTFLLGMAEHDPPAVVIPSKGKARLASSQKRATAAARGESDHSDDDGHGHARGLQDGHNGQLHSKNGDGDGVWSIFRAFWTNYDLSLDNVGSVARDHLANERTFLAWMRTSLALSSIGVAITQLFRLTSSSYALPSRPLQDASTVTSTGLGPVPTVATEDLPAAVSYLLATIQQQQQEILALGVSTESERGRYQKLGKPIGGTFLVLGLVFMALGGHRYLSIQHHLVSKNHFPPARRSVLLSSFLVMALLVATFASILSIH